MWGRKSAHAQQEDRFKRHWVGLLCSQSLEDCIVLKTYEELRVGGRLGFAGFFCALAHSVMAGCLSVCDTAVGLVALICLAHCPFLGIESQRRCAGG